MKARWPALVIVVGLLGAYLLWPSKKAGEPTSDVSVADKEAKGQGSSRRVGLGAMPELHAGTSVSGYVRSTEGDVVANATVCARGSLSRGELPACATTNKRGAYRMDIGSGHFVLVASATGYRLTEVQRIEVGDEPLVDVNLILEAAEPTLSGTVLDLLGGPVASATLSWNAVNGTTPAFGRARSGDDGEFALVTPPGEVFVFVDAILLRSFCDPSGVSELRRRRRGDPRSFRG